MQRAWLVAALLLVGGPAALGDERGWTLYSPPSAKAPAPVIVVLHCLTCTPAMVMENMHLGELAAAHGAMLAMPLGRVSPHGVPFWDATDACCNFQHLPGDDVAFLQRVIDDAVAHGGDPKRVYLVGYSNGGFMAHRLACDVAGKIAAIVSVVGAGWNDDARCKATQPVSLLEIRGDADELVPYDGGQAGGGLPRTGTMPSARADVERWARRDGCQPASRAGDAIDLEAKLPGAETRVERWSCKRAAVELWTVHGGKHLLDFTNDASERIWQWLAAQHK